jgi:hypothetical protein
MTTYNLSAFAGAGTQFFDDNGIPLVSGKLYTYASGTTTPLATYITSAGAVANTNPIILDAGGRTPNEIWLATGVLFKFVLKTSTDVLIGTYDGIPSVNDPFGIYSQLGSVAGTNAITATATPTLTAYASGATYSFVAANTNTGAATLSIDGLVAKSITKNGSVALSAGDVQSGKMMLVEYDGTTFQLLNNIIYGGSITNGNIVSLTAPMSVANGGTGVATLTTNNVVLGNGASAVQFVAPSTSGNLLTSDGTTWTSATPAIIAPTAIGQVPFSTNGTSYAATQKIVLGTAQAATSGATIDFSSIPSWVKRITVMFAGVSTTGTSPVQIQFGTSGGVQTSGYNGTITQQQQSAANVVSSLSSGFLVTDSTGSLAAQTLYGSVIFEQFSTTEWTGFGIVANTTTTPRAYNVCGYKSLAATLTTVRITTVGGTDTFDAGSVNIMYE